MINWKDIATPSNKLGVFDNPNMRVTITLGDLTALVNRIDELETDLTLATEDDRGVL